MKRTTAEANDGNRYTEGNPSLGIPATVVGAEELNNIQEEIVNVVLDAGLTLDAGTENQLLQAINIKLSGGGIVSNQITQSVLNNQAATPITGLVFSSTSVKGFRVLFDIARSTGSSNVTEVGEIFGSFNPITSVWAIEEQSYVGDAGLTWSIDSTGQIFYASSNITGSSYTGTVRCHNIFKLKV